MPPVNVPSLVNTITAVLPNIVELIKAIRGQVTPDTPPPTDAEVIAALNEAVTAGLAVAEAWKAAHPEG